MSSREKRIEDLAVVLYAFREDHDIRTADEIWPLLCEWEASEYVDHATDFIDYLNGDL